MGGRKVIALALGMLLAGAAPASAGLKLGDPAPPLMVTDWVKLNPFSDWSKDKPINLAKSAAGKVVVLEFWATWCPPCIELIPESNTLYSSYKDHGLLLIALTDSGRGQQLSAVQTFVQRRGDGMNFPVAYDKSQQSSVSYVFEAGGMGLPHAVVLDKTGKVAWMGHPGMPDMRKVIEDLIHDRFDLRKVTARAEAEAKVRPLVMDFNAAATRGDWEKCMAISNEILTLDPTNYDAMRFTIAILIDEIKSIPRLKQWTEDFISRHSGDADALIQLSRLLTNIPDIPKRQPDLALQAAQAACKADGDSVDAMQVLATITQQIGDVDRAIDLQRRVVEKATGRQLEEARQILSYFEMCKALRGRLSAG